MLYRPTSKSPPRTRILWPTKVGPSTGSNVGISHAVVEYIGETSRSFGERFKVHLKEPSPIHHYSINTVHPTTQHNFQIIGREGHGTARIIKESNNIRVNNPTLIYSIYGIGSSLTPLVLKQKGMHKLLGMLRIPNLTPQHH